MHHGDLTGGGLQATKQGLQVTKQYSSPPSVILPLLSLLQIEENSKCTTPRCTLCPAVTTAIEEILDFSMTGRTSRAMRKLRGLVAAAGGEVAYYPGDTSVSVPIF